MSQRILVVEDDADQRGLVSSILEGSGYAVAQAASLAEAQQALNAAPVDLVLSDWQLGDGDGTQLLRTVRSGLSGTAFVMVTAYGTIARAVEALRA